MHSIYPDLALCCRKNERARTDTVFFPISEVSKGTVSLNRGEAGAWEPFKDNIPYFVMSPSESIFKRKPDN